MIGRTHTVFGAASGAVVGTVAGTAMHDPRAAVTVLALSTMFATGPDVDHKPAPMGRRFPPVRWVVHVLSWCFQLDRHRGITHTAAFALLVGGLAVWTMIALHASWAWALVAGLGVTTGWASHLVGDWLTRSSLPDVWWPFARDVDGPAYRFRTGGWVERWLIYPLGVASMLGGLFLMVWAMR